jgi:sulfide dehydrogenase cytochrome subunit
MKSPILRIALLVFSSCLGHTAVAELPTAAMLANTCAGCHGTNGSSVGPASPTIAGISRDYFIESMQAYQSGERLSTIMQRIAKGYNEAEIELMADYFSRQMFNRHQQEHDAKQADFGRRLHKKYCEKCHEDGGRTADDDSGILAGQWAAYLRYAMQDFINGDRPMEKKMKKRVTELQTDHGEQGVEALIQFYASQQ